jgi:hypothetical protein
MKMRVVRREEQKENVPQGLMFRTCSDFSSLTFELKELNPDRKKL